MQELPLNAGQQAAADGFFAFLFGPDKELIISGPGGFGKTFLMGHLIDEIMPRYHKTCTMMGIKSEYEEVVMTATTNKAAEILGLATGRPSQTIHSFLSLTVKNDFNTGRSILTKGKGWRVHRNIIIFVDEAYMIDTQLLNMIREGTHQCKIIYVGDHCQLAPVMEPISPIHKQGLPFFELTKPMRTNIPELHAVNNQLRKSVETGIFLPIQIVPGIIDHLDGPEMEQEIDTHFRGIVDNSRILAYKNEKVVAYNDHIRQLRQLTEPYTLGEILINNNAIQFSNGMLSVEQEVEIIRLEETEWMEFGDQVRLLVRYADLKTRFGDIYTNVPLPEDRDHYTALVKYYQKLKNWGTYFYLKNTFPDLRPRDAATIHKAQGSTYGTVFIDLGDLSTCHNPNVAARLMYVGFTRAKNRVVMYGELAEKYGGLIH